MSAGSSPDHFEHVFDPYCNPDEAFLSYGINLKDEKQMSVFDAVVFAVPHRSYCEWDITHWKSLLVKGGVVIDIKNAAPSKELRTAGYVVWKL